MQIYVVQINKYVSVHNQERSHPIDKITDWGENNTKVINYGFKIVVIALTFLFISGGFFKASCLFFVEIN